MLPQTTDRSPEVVFPAEFLSPSFQVFFSHPILLGVSESGPGFSEQEPVVEHDESHGEHAVVADAGLGVCDGFPGLQDLSFLPDAG